MTPHFAFWGWVLALLALVLLTVSNLRIAEMDTRIKALEQKAKP